MEHEGATGVIRTGIRFGLFLLGGLLLAAGQYTLAAASTALTSGTGQAAWALRIGGVMPEVLPAGVDAGLGMLMLGALLVAAGIGSTPRRRKRAETDPQPPTVLSRTPHAVAAGIGIACALAAIGTWMSTAKDPGTGTVLVWLSALAVGFAAMARWDQFRGTSFGHPLSRREWLLLAVIVGLDLVLIAHDLDDWRWAGTPDEADFFALAKTMAQGTWQGFLLSDHGVFGMFPTLGSYYQSLFIRAFGANIVGCRLSSAAAVAGSLPFLYLLTRELWNRCAAWMAVLFLGSAELAVGFAHFGYLNVQVYPITTGALGMLLWGSRQRSRLAYYLAGVFAGLGFYTFQAARFVPALVLLLGVSVGALSLRRGARRLALALALGFIFTAAPACLHPSELIARLLQHTAVTGGQPATGPLLTAYIDAYLRSGNMLARLAHHWLLAVVYGFWFKPAPPGQWNHFQWNPIINPMCGALVAIGLCMCLGGLFRRGDATFVVLAYLLSALVIGATSEYDRPPLTRLLFLAPFSAMLAAAALERLVRCAAQATKNRRVAWASGLVVVVTSIAWSALAVHHNISDHYHGFGDGTTSELLRVVQTLPPSCKIVYIQRRNTANGWVDEVLAEYGITDRFGYFRQTDQRAVRALSELQPPAVIFYDLDRAEDILLIRGLLAARFPGVEWSNTDPGRLWNLSYLYVPAPADPPVRLLPGQS